MQTNNMKQPYNPLWNAADFQQLRKYRGSSKLISDTEEYYNKQCEQLASYLLLQDNKPTISTEKFKVKIEGYKLKWINKGELVSGSHIISVLYYYNNFVGDIIEYNDIDIFFKSKEDAIEFARLNNFPPDLEFKDNPVCTYWRCNGHTINMIYGIEYVSPEDLVSSFDIRACSVALDPNSNTLTLVSGAFDDILEKVIVFNPVPRTTSVARLFKYAAKGFEIAPRQRLFFTQLIRSDIWNPELELATGIYKTIYIIVSIISSSNGEIMKIYKTPSEAYIETLRDIYYNYEYRSSPRGLACREKTDYTFRVLEPNSSPIITKDLERNKTIESYTAKEVELYNSCTNLAEDFGKASKFWLGLANPDGTVNSAYGHLIWQNKSHGNNFEPAVHKIPAVLDGEEGHFLEEGPTLRTPWEWAKESLIKDKDTRQAIVRFSLPEHQWFDNKDQVCTMHANFLIRENKLNLSVVMRSNDLNRGLVYDLPWFCSLIDRMVDELKPIYPELTKGHYTHTVHSLHIYEKEADVILKMIGDKGV